MDREVDRGAGLSRRGLIGGALVLLSSTALSPAMAGGAAWARVPVRARRSVVAFHADQLYVDHSGLAEPYVGPAGLRSLDGHDEAALSRLVYNI